MTKETTSENDANGNVDNIEVIVSAATRGPRRSVKSISKESLSQNINVFITQVGYTLQELPESVKGFRLDQIEVHAEITASGKIALLGFGGEAGIAGGIKFIFKK